MHFRTTSGCTSGTTSRCTSGTTSGCTSDCTSCYNSFPLWSRILDVLPVALPALFPVTLQVTLPSLCPVALPVLLLVALPVILLAALLLLLLIALLAVLPVMIFNFNILKVDELIEFLFYILLPFCNFSLCETGCLEDRSFT